MSHGSPAYIVIYRHKTININNLTQQDKMEVEVCLDLKHIIDVPKMH